MLKLLMRIFCKDEVYTDEKALFYKLYKWDAGLLILLTLRRKIGAIFFTILGMVCTFFTKRIMFGWGFTTIAFLLICLDEIETEKQWEITRKIWYFIKKFVSQNGGALGKKEWKAIKEVDIALYKDLLCENCEHCCYYYSLEIAKIIKDSTLIWGAIEEPTKKGHKYCAHAVILRNGYIYDSNLHQSEKYEDFIKFYKFKLYKQWNYQEYSRENFRYSEREKFRKWCKKNNVLNYDLF